MVWLILDGSWLEDEVGGVSALVSGSQITPPGVFSYAGWTYDVAVLPLAVGLCLVIRSGVRLRASQHSPPLHRLKTREAGCPQSHATGPGHHHPMPCEGKPISKVSTGGLSERTYHPLQPMGGWKGAGEPVGRLRRARHWERQRTTSQSTPYIHTETSML
jgi:hypothetical protein